MNKLDLLKSKLYFKEGNSDKIYEAQVEAVPGGFLVNFSFGRRGAKLQAGTKTPTPVSLEQATLIFEKLIKEKTAKGYTPDEEGTPFVDSKDESKVSGYLPQLLNPIAIEELMPLLSDDQWVAQQKYDGQRMLIEVKDHKAQAINRRGLFVDGDPETLKQAESLSKGLHIVLDGEQVGDHYYVFDLLFANQDIRHETYFDRYAQLKELLNTSSTNLHLVETATTTSEKMTLLSTLKAKNAEGIIVKRNTPYTPGRPNSYGDQLKFKFIESASVFVTGINTQRSVSIAVYQDNEPISVGNVTIFPNMAIPAVDDVLEVQYLYAMKGTNALFQPVCLGIRADISKDECTLDQLKYKEI